MNGSKKYIRIFLLLLLFSGLSAKAQQDTSYTLSLTKGCLLKEGFRSSKVKVAPPALLIHSSISAIYAQENAALNLAVRWRRAKGDWSSWQSLAPQHEGGTPGRSTFGPLITSEAYDTLQFRADQKIEKVLTFRVYFAVEQKSTQKKTLNRSTNTCSCDTISICARACWCPNNACPPDPSPAPQKVTHFIVHHTAGTATNPRAVMRAIWDFHVNTNGWDDIGYNYLIGQNGEIFAGRADSLRGAHFSCMNPQTMGVALMGNLHTSAPTDSALLALQKLLTVKSCRFNVNVAGRSLHPASQLNLRHISGHRDGNTATVGCPKGTVCPGDSLYPLLPWLIDSIAGRPCLQGVGLKEELPEQNLSIYPNPTTQDVWLPSPKGGGTWRIYNLRGELQWQGNGLNHTLYHLSVKDWPKGIYLARLTTSTGLAFRQKLVVL